MPSRSSEARGLLWKEVLACLAATAAVSAAFVWFCCARGYTLYYGDAASHVNIARRIVDSRTPGYEQFGTVWLPLPHALMLPLVRQDELWRSGLAGAIPAAAFFTAGVAFLYAAVWRATGSRAAAVTGAAIAALNPNLLYLQATPMTEPVFFGCFAAAIYGCVRFEGSRHWGYALGAGVAVLAATLTRYDGWFLLPFLALFFWLAGSGRVAILFLAVAGLGPLYWLAHNYYFYSDPLEFYRGEFSALAIYSRGLARGYAHHPGDHDWLTACTYYRRAMETVLGRPVVWLAPLGLALALFRRPARGLVLLALPVPFYVASIHSGGTPLFVPSLFPHSYYNTRYALAALPACAAAAGLAVALFPRPTLRALAAAGLLALALGGWVLRPSVENWVCWKESQVNSLGRRAWTAQAAAFFRQAYRPGDGILTTGGDVLAIYQSYGLPLRETLNDGSKFPFWPAVQRPDLFWNARWAVAVSGDPISQSLRPSSRFAPLSEKVAEFTAEREPVIEIYRNLR